MGGRRVDGRKECRSESGATREGQRADCAGDADAREDEGGTGESLFCFFSFPTENNVSDENNYLRSCFSRPGRLQDDLTPRHFPLP